MRYQHLLVVGLGLFFVACAGGKPSTVATAPANANIRSFNAPYEQVWKAMLEVVEYDYLLGLDLQDKKKGIFSTEMIRDYQPIRRRYRISGTLSVVDSQTVVKLYKHEEIFQDNQWKAVPSDTQYEYQMLGRVAQKLEKALGPKAK